MSLKAKDKNIIIGRDPEIALLRQFMNSDHPEFLAVYGRRRIGKTYLIRHFFESNQNLHYFDVTGVKKASQAIQIKHFLDRIGNVFYKGVTLASKKNWDEVFDTLTRAMQSVDDVKKIILFFDEFPWMATKNSKLLQYLEYYWNQHWSKDKRIKLIVCGSSASWIIEKIVNNKEGLHNRLTHSIFLQPFDLNKTKIFLNAQGFRLTNRQILQIYMVTGGIPFYLTKIEKGLSATENIQKLAFNKRSFFLNEFENLFSSLFDEAEDYIKMLRLIAKHRYGIGQDELLKKMSSAERGAKGLKMLKTLINTSFIASFKPYQNQQKGVYYSVIDEYTLFYFSWIEPVKDTLQEKGLSKRYWETLQTTPAWYSWAGYAFESICFEHIPQIMQVLDLSPTAIPSSWRYVPRKGSQEQGAQIDLFFDRIDDSVYICEIKYSNQPYTVDKAFIKNLQQKEAVFKKVTRSKKQIFYIVISAEGIKNNMYSEDFISKVVTLDDLFEAVDA